MTRKNKPQKSRIGSSSNQWRDPSTVGPKIPCGIVALALLAAPVVTVARAVSLFN